MAEDTLISLIQKACRESADKTAVRFYRKARLETSLSYAEIDHDSSRMASYMSGLGVGMQDRVILLLEKSAAFIIIHLALQKIGAVCVPLNPGFKASELAYFLEDASPSAVFCGRRQGELVRTMDENMQVITVDTSVPYADLSFFRDADTGVSVTDARSSDPGLIIYTSGTTGKPKGALLAQSNLCFDAGNIIEAWEISENDVLLHALPLFHVHGLCFALHTCLIAGASIIMLDRFAPDTVLKFLSETSPSERCTVFMAVPAMYGMLLKTLNYDRPDFSHLRLITSGSAPLLPRDFYDIHQKFGQEPVEREGMSETGMNFSNPLHGIRKPGSIGLPLPGVRVRIVNPDTFRDEPAGETGEIWLKSPSIAKEYWQKPEETEKAFEQGWFRTGDLGYKGQDGYYYLTDRIKNIIISGGENISPKEIESVINQLEAVDASCVVGIKDEKWGEKVCAAIVLKKTGSLDAGTVTGHLKSRLHEWKCPKQIVFTDSLPKNTMGKVLTAEVRKLFTRLNH